MNTQRKNMKAMLAGRKSVQKGYTIVELSIAVAIAGVLLVSAIGLVQTVLTTNRANETTTLLIKAMAQIDKIWADQPDYNGLNVATAGAAGVFNGMQIARVAGAVAGVTSKFNRPVYVAVAPDLPVVGTNRGYVITFTGIPTSVCADLVAAAAGGGIRGIIVSPEPAAGVAAAVVPTALSAGGVLTQPATVPVSIVAIDAAVTNMYIPATMGKDGCGTPNATVALSFVNWK
jgi:prepilin-type N-terminal cleavage/methylation domain-containing protein